MLVLTPADDVLMFMAAKWGDGVWCKLFIGILEPFTNYEIEEIIVDANAVLLLLFLHLEKVLQCK